LPAFRHHEAEGPIPARAGVGLKAPHYAEIVEMLPDVGFFEFHPENYFGVGGDIGGGPSHRYLQAIAGHYPLSMHGVGLSLGSDAPLDEDHLRALKALAGRYAPALVSEHLSWSFSNGVFMNDLLELPLTGATLAHVASRIGRVQDALGRQILIENPSSYLSYEISDMDEPRFLNELAERSGCGILLDVNNVYVSAVNVGLDAEAYIAAIDVRHIGEIHLAGHARRRVQGVDVLIDDHGAKVDDAVWALFERLIGRTGPVPALVEWDTDVPALEVLLAEVGKANAIMSGATVPPHRGDAHVDAA